MLGYSCRYPVLPKWYDLPVKSEKYSLLDDYEVHEYVAELLPVRLEGFCMIKPIIEPLSVMKSLRKRLYHRPKDHVHALWAELRGFVYRWCKANLRPLDSVMSFEEWLDSTHYSKRLKEKFVEVRKNALPSDVFKAVVKCFVKDEFYAQPKAPRMIASREDCAKVFLGPIFKSIEEEVYTLPYFVKHLTTAERVAKIKETFGLEEVLITDYTSFETHFTSEMMKHCEMVVYDYLLQCFPKERNLVHVLLRENKMRSKLFTGKLDGVRMSGEMNTSLGNCISNLMFMQFAAYKSGCRVRECLVEGDDGMFIFDGTLDTSLFDKMGLDIKMQTAHAYDGSFCGCVFNPETCTNFGHPIEHLAKLGWKHRRHMSYSHKREHELLMSKVYSSCAEFQGVPVVWKVQELILKHESSVKFCRARKYVDKWKWEERGGWFQAKAVRPVMQDRLYFQELTGITPSDQLIIESELSRSYPRMISPKLLQMIPENLVDNWNNYVV